MLNTIFTGLLKAATVSDFQAYWTDLQSAGLPGTPKLEEARREYRALVLRRERQDLF